MKGVMSIIEVMITGLILLIAFLHFFPQYSIKSRWNSALLTVKVIDVLRTIDRLNKTYEFTTDLDKFDKFMNVTFLPEETGDVIVWWRNINGISAPFDKTPYFTEGYRESMVDVDSVPHELSVTPDTVSLWHFNEGSGTTAFDESPNNNDGTLMNMESSDWVAGMFNSALAFDGVNEYIDTSKSSSDNNKFTLEAFFKTTATAPNDAFGFRILTIHDTNSASGSTRITLYLKGNDVGIGYRNSSGSFFERTVTRTYNNDKWHQLIGTHNGSAAKLYFDGELLGTWSDTLKIGSITYTDKIATFNKTHGNFNGVIDEVRILNKTLSDDEVKADFGSYKVYSFTLGLGYPF